MSNAPLMPKATAVWLVENTSLTFDQIADFCKLHPLEVKGIADGEVAAGIKGHDPITSGQLTREEIAKGEANAERRLSLAVAKVRLPEMKKQRGPRYTPLTRRQDRPNATLLPADVTTGPQPDVPLSHEDVFGIVRKPAPRDEEDDIDVDSVFAKLKDLRVKE